MSSPEVTTAIEIIQKVARRMATCFQDPNAIWLELKDAEPEFLQSILDQYKGTIYPVQMVREFVAWKLLTGAQWGNEQHLALLDAIRRRDRDFFFGFRDVEFSSDKADPFRTWTNPARIYLPFLIPNAEKVQTSLQVLSEDLSARLGQPHLKCTLWDFNGSTNFGQETAALAFFPDNKMGHQEAWQLFVEIRWDGFDFGLLAGKSLGKQENVLERAETWDLVADGLTKLVPQFIAKNQSTRRFLQWAPGQAARYWEEFHQLGVVAVGWDALGDLTQFQTREALAEALGVANPDASNEVMNLTLFLEASIGDVVVAKQGRKAAVGIGIITGAYEYHPERTTYKHMRKCQWIVAKPIDFGVSMFRADTLATTRKWPEIASGYAEKFPELADVLKQVTKGQPLTSPGPMIPEIVVQPEPPPALALNPTNIILYGPPGTGKTFNSIDWALSLIEQKDLGVIQNEERTLRRERFQHYLDSDKIKFVTFHQSFSYEDFVEGIKPDLEAEEGTLQYEIQPGLFRLICRDAEENWRGALNQNVPRGFDELWAEFVLPLDEETGKTLNVPTPRGFYTITDVNSRTIRFNKMAGNSVHSLAIATLRQLFYNERKVPAGLSPYYNSLVDLLRQRQRASQKAPVKALSQFVLVIDEINRGNVAQILGELITLLEPDKRLGMKESLTLQLPYSKRSFGVPPNLHIIGTMNTADRSVEALDTALRRRFIFKESMPDPTLITLEACRDRWGEEWELEDLDLCELLDTVNNRLIRLLDRDHTIGHAFFIDIHDLDGLREVFADKVIPLLQEFFYGDWSRIGLILGGRFIQEDKEVGLTGFAAFDTDIGDIDDRRIYSITPVSVWDAAAFKSIYATAALSQET